MSSVAGHLRHRIRTVDRILEKTYGPSPPPAEGDLLDVLIGTILSQNTNDVNSHRAYEAMRQAFPTWRDVMQAPRRRLEQALKPGGLAKTKSARIHRILRTIADEGPLDLGHLRNLSSEEVEQRLLAFDGVGLKTARCVLLFGLGRDVFPVDTHIHRILIRLGIVESGMTADQTHVRVPALIPKDRCYPLHVHLLAHGRQVCRPRNPACATCPLRRHCPSAEG